MLRIFAGLVMLTAFSGCSSEYQGTAENLPWTWSEEKATLGYSIDHYLRDYQVEVVSPESKLTNHLTIRVKNGDRVVCSWEGHRETVFVNNENALFVACMSPIATGCLVVALDLASGEQLWQTQLKGIGPVGHSQYRNKVNMETDGKAIIIRGNEAFGRRRYIEILNIKTGKTVGHRVYKDGE